MLRQVVRQLAIGTGIHIVDERRNGAFEIASVKVIECALLTSLDILIARNIRNNRTIHSSTPKRIRRLDYQPIRMKRELTCLFGSEQSDTFWSRCVDQDTAADQRMIDTSSVSVFGTYLACRGKQSISVSGQKRTSHLGRVEFWVCEGFRMPAPWRWRGGHR